MPKPSGHKSVQLPEAALSHMSERALDRLPDHVKLEAEPVHVELAAELTDAFYFDLDTGSVATPNGTDYDAAFFINSFGVQVINGSGMPNRVLEDFGFDNYENIAIPDWGGSVSKNAEPDDVFLHLSTEGDVYAIGNIGFDGTTLQFDYVLIV